MVPYKLGISQSSTSVRISQLIGFLFTNDITSDINSVNDVLSIFTKASEYKGELKLQITEIAINEGTTKDFTSASLTELVQNSVDAIRNSSRDDNVDNNLSRKINITFGKNKEGTAYSFVVEDFVGMTPSAFLHIAIPFLSTKTPSELVTGEMGSGFFNVYRESESVIIETVHKGIKLISYDTPILENGRVVDVNKVIYVDNNTKSMDSTRIIVNSRKTLTGTPSNKVLENISENIGNIKYLCDSVLSQVTLFNDITMDINNEKVRINAKTHMFTKGYFDVYIIKDTTLPSYVFTKGIPFAPLTNFYSDYDYTVLPDIDTGIIINIRHGGYTPVQTRTRLNFSGESDKIFDEVLAYTILVKNLYLAYDTLLHGKATDRGREIPNINSTAPANQLSGALYQITKSSKAYHYLLYANFKMGVGIPVSSLQFYLNEIIKILGDSDPSDVEVNTLLKREISKFNISEFPEIRKMGEYIILRWISNKNKNVVKTPIKRVTVKGKDKKAVIIEMRDYKPDVPDKLMEPYVKIWIETFRDKAIEAAIFGWSKIDNLRIETVISEEYEYALGYYNRAKHQISINTIRWTDKDRNGIISHVKNVKTTFDFQSSTIGGEQWNKYFTFRYPASTLPHELEHVRRKETHSDNSGSHDVTRVALWMGDIAHERTFDQSANDVFSKVISIGFYDELMLRYKQAKLM